LDAFGVRVAGLGRSHSSYEINWLFRNIVKRCGSG